MAELGAPAHAIMSWSGHKTLAEAQEFTVKADRKRVLIGPEQKQNTVNQAKLSSKLERK
nr:hypothetical protein [Aliiruegeria lutimaris]